MKTVDDKLQHPESVDNRILQIQNRILDRTLVLGTIIAFFALAASLSRIASTGFHLAQGVQAVLFAVLSLIVLLRKRIPYIYRFCVWVILLVLAGVSGLYSYGLTGQGPMLIMCAVATAPAFVKKNSVVAIMLIGFAVIGIFAILYSTGTVALDFTLDKYMRSYTSWLSFMLSFVLFAGLVISVTNGLFHNLFDISRTSIIQANHIRDLNQNLEKKVALQTGELKKSIREKDRILGVVAHDINNKLSGIIGYLDLLGDEVMGENRELCREYTERGLEASMMAKEIVKELLEFAKTEADSSELITEPVNICEFVESTVECHIPRALDKNIKLKMGKKPAYLFCHLNRASFSRVIDNLITNALKFTQTDGEVTVDITEFPEKVEIRVSDTGIGVPSALQANIFKPFSASRRNGTADEKSTGLGLSITRKIVEQHSGTIVLDSKDGEGSTFVVELPRQDVEK